MSLAPTVRLVDAISRMMKMVMVKVKVKGKKDCRCEAGFYTVLQVARNVSVKLG